VGLVVIEEEEEVSQVVGVEVSFSLGTTRNCNRSTDGRTGRGGFQQSYGPPAQVLGEFERTMRLR
jgi:hypothetical protein